jgi:REP element-mobilizing transposase RayT
MALTEHYHTKFEEGNFYHIYNRTVDRKPMFKNEGNYEFFLRKYDHYLSPVLDTYAYCLLGNHFHLLVRVKDGIQELSTLGELTTLSNTPEKNTHDIVSLQFRKFFQSYAMAFNKQRERIGTLFQTPFKRAWVDDDHYFTQLVYYIHANPQLHGLINDFREWKWSSYGRILMDRPSKLKKQEVIEWFGEIMEYKKFHSKKHKMINDEKYVLEDE